MNPDLTPVRISLAQIARAAQTLARAFHTDSWLTRLFPVEALRARTLPLLFAPGVRYGCLFGEVYATPELDGIAIWLTPGNTTLTFWRMFRAGMLAVPFHVGLSVVQRMLPMVNYTEKLRHRLAPPKHWYLFQIGVAPERQGGGIGKALLDPVLARADAAHVSCYLETQTEANVRFYEKRGFRVMAEGGAPGDALPLWAMLRLPLSSKS